MKRITHFLFCLSITISCSSEKAVVKTDLEHVNLNGDVRKVERKLHSAVARVACPAAERSESNNSIYTYNKRGFITESFDLDNDGEIVVAYRYGYRKRHLQEIEKTDRKDTKKKITNQYTKGLLTESKEIDSNGNIEVEYQYDYSGKDITGGKVLDGSGNIKSSFTNEYQDGQINIQTQYDEAGNQVSVSRFRRNEHNDIVEYLISNKTADTEYRVTVDYDYDSYGNWVKQTQRFDSEIIAIIIRTIEYYSGQV